MKGLAIIAVVAIAGCTKGAPTVVKRSGAKSPQAVMVHVAKQAQTCWFKTRDPALARYRIAPELNSFSGRPRILIVPRNKPTALPRLVAQAERVSGRTRFTTFGPLLETSDGPRLDASLNAWARGSTTCSAKA